MRLLVFLIVVCLPSLCLAANVFSVEPTDKSMEYLSAVFGSVQGMPIQSDSANNPLFSQIVYIFNQVIFALGIIIIVYTTLVGTLNTAQEGKFLGKSWHPILVPLRAAIGTYLLLPTATGYNWIQIGVMWFIIQGVGAANALWKQVIISNETQGSIHQAESAATLENSMSTVSAIFNADICMQAINSNTTATNQLGTQVSVFVANGQVQWGRAAFAGTEQAICGAIKLPSVGGSVASTTSGSTIAANQTIFANAIIQAASSLYGAAQESLAGQQTQAPVFVTAARSLENAALQTQADKSLSDVNQLSIENGWIHAGSYYFQLTQGGPVSTTPVTMTSSGMNTTTLTQLLGPTLANQIIGKTNSASASYIQYVNSILGPGATTSSTTGRLQLNVPSGGGASQSLLGIIFGDLFGSIIEKLDDHMTTGGANEDPIISMAQFGSQLTTITEMTFWAALALVFISWSISSIMSCMNPMGHAMDFVLSMFMPIATLMISLLWTEGIALGLYVPLIPYLVFSFSAITWLILVIESMLGAPLIALSLIVPSEEEIGKAGYAIIILLGLFLRPALMIVGFVLAIQLLKVGISMLNFGFWATITANTGAAAGVGIFGLIAVIFIYSAVAVGMVHEAFSLIYVLPNKVLRWMGGGPEDDSAGQHVKELKGNVQKGAGIGKNMMSSTLTKFSAKKGGGGK